MASLLAASGKHLAAALRLHAHAETMRLGAPPPARLKCSLWQSNPPLSLTLLYFTCGADLVFRRRTLGVLRRQTVLDRLLPQPFPNQ
jgi:hypothetical protein